MNMHPRSFELIEEYKADIGADTELLKEKYSKEWLVLVDGYCQHLKGTCILFGQDVTNRENRLKVTIPYPCSPEAIEEVYKALKGEK